MIKGLIVIAPLLLIGPTLLGAQEITGRVVDLSGQAIGAARVRVQATEFATLTDKEGRFSLDLPSDPPFTLAAWKEGYYISGQTITELGTELLLTLKPIAFPDQPDYPWLSPFRPHWWQYLDIAWRRAMATLTGNETWKSHYEVNCQNCHPEIVREWRQSAHAQGANNVILKTSYEGTDSEGNENVFPGYKLDFPKSAGNCATCHAPVAALANPWGTDLGEITGLPREGIICDFCHKIEALSLHPEGGYPGVLSVQLKRPPRGEQVFFGPFDDVTVGLDTFAPAMKESRFCAPCHSARFWGTPVYSEFEEWSESPYPSKGVSCQACHMKSEETIDHFVAPEKGGVKRPPKSIPSHKLTSASDPQFFSKAVTLTLDYQVQHSQLIVTVSIHNKGVGHHMPTGVPMRQLLLLVEATDASGQALELLEGPRLPDWAGLGPAADANYGGLPGKGFAKILADANKDYPKLSKDRRLPAPHWRQTVIASDNRIPAEGRDKSRFIYHLSPGQNEIELKAHLLYRRTFKAWSDAKKWSVADIEVAQVTKSLTIDTSLWEK